MQDVIWRGHCCLSEDVQDSYGVFGFAQKLYAHLLAIGPAVTFNEIWCATLFLITSYSCIESCVSLQF